MGLFSRFRRRRRRGGARGATKADTEHLAQWTASRRGVEAYVEPETIVTETTVMLVAHDGEWTRRRVHGVAGAHKLGKQLSIPVYEVAKTGYPQRMRDFTERQRVVRRRERREQFGQ